ncbi:hypothetical protein BSPWISOXPB_10866 [uncultured Gammaproteobacteria bacterium]|nr:hypothetical protein BSPWISOXPB_10866 [uncultured Gammaproteobacteria bacterium]
MPPLKPMDQSRHGVIRMGGTGAPSDNGYTKIYSTGLPLPPLKPMGQSRRGVFGLGGTGAPSDNGYTKIYSTCCLAALKADGSITAWGLRIWRHRRTL